MTKFLEIYKCNVCGNIVEMVHASKGELVCCGQKMENQIAGTVEASYEKHIPVVDNTCTCSSVSIKVGSVDHPMVKEHYIEWIEYVADGVSNTQFLKPEDKPVACFNPTNNDAYTVRAYCNIHGLWENKF